MTKVFFETRGNKHQLSSCLRYACESMAAPPPAGAEPMAGPSQQSASQEEPNGTLLTWRKQCEKQLGDAASGGGAGGGGTTVDTALDRWGLGFALRLLRIEVSDHLVRAAVHCLSLASHRLSVASHSLSVASHCLWLTCPLPVHCLFTALP